MITFDGIVPYKNKDTLPETSGIYFVICGDVVQYIGQSVNINARFGYHHHRSPEFKRLQNASIGWINVSKDELLKTERELIGHYEPALNGKIGKPKGNKSPYQNPMPMRINDEQLAHCQKMAVIHGHVNAYIRHLIDKDMQ